MSVTTVVKVSDWLFKMEEERITNPFSAWQVGSAKAIWLPAPSVVQYKANGWPHGEPHWLHGERVFFATLRTGLCFAVGEIVDPADWDPVEERYRFTPLITAVSFDKPLRLADHGVVMNQGSRQTIEDYQADALERGLRVYVGLPTL